MTAFYVGQRFSSYSEFKAELEKFSSLNFVQFYLRHSHTLENMSKRIKRASRANKNLKYYQLKVCCIHGGRKFYFNRRSRFLRNTKTFRQGCGAHISLALSRNGQYLEITELDFEHNHEISKELFQCLPHQRRLPSPIRKKALHLLKMNADKKMLQQQLMLETGKVIFMKDIKNLAQQALISDLDESRKEMCGIKDVVEIFCPSVSSSGQDSTNMASQMDGSNPVEEFSENSSVCVLTTVMDLNKKNEKSKSEIQHQAATIGIEIASILSQCSGEQFEKRIEVMKTLLRYWKDGKEVGIFPEDSAATYNGTNNMSSSTATVNGAVFDLLSVSGNTQNGEKRLTYIHSLRPPNGNIFSSINSAKNQA